MTAVKTDRTRSRLHPGISGTLLLLLSFLATTALGQEGSGDESEKRAVRGTDRPSHLIMTRHVGGLQKDLDVLADHIREEEDRPEFVPHAECPTDDAPKYRKKIGVAGFVLEQPTQGSLGGLYETGSAVSKALYQQLMNDGDVLPVHIPGRKVVASQALSTTEPRFDNRLQKYASASREMGVQFVVSGIVRSVDVLDESAWDTSSYSKIKRALFSADTSREFVVDVVVHDGFTGRVLMEERYSTAGRWDVERTRALGFGSEAFNQTDYGQAVEEAMAVIADDITGKVACQPMLVPIISVSGKEMTLDVGTGSKLLPGDRLRILRAEHSMSNPVGVPRLRDTGLTAHIHSMTLESSIVWMHTETARANVWPGDYAVIY